MNCSIVYASLDNFLCSLLSDTKATEITFKAFTFYEFFFLVCYFCYISWQKVPTDLFIPNNFLVLLISKEFFANSWNFQEVLSAKKKNSFMFFIHSSIASIQLLNLFQLDHKKLELVLIIIYEFQSLVWLNMPSCRNNISSQYWKIINFVHTYSTTCQPLSFYQ